MTFLLIKVKKFKNFGFNLLKILIYFLMKNLKNQVKYHFKNY